MSPFLSWYFTRTTPQGYQGTEMAVASFCATVAYPAISKTNVVRLILHHLHPQDLRGSSSFSLNSRWGPNTWTWTRIFPTVHHSIIFFPIHPFGFPTGNRVKIPFGLSKGGRQKQCYMSWVSEGGVEESVCERCSTSPATLIRSKSYQIVENLRQDPWLTI